MTKDKAYWEDATGKWFGLEVVGVLKPNSSFIVEWDYHAEGVTSEFDSSNSDDLPLLRFTVLVKNPDTPYSEPSETPNPIDFIQAANGSFCSQIPVDIGRMNLLHFTQEVMIPVLAPLLKDGKSIKKVCEQFSWCNDKDVKKANKSRIIPLTNEAEFYTSGAYLMGVMINGKKYLIVTKLETDTFCDGLNCDERMEQEYGL